MKDPDSFSIKLALHSLRSRLSKSGAFTYDNINELESHVRDAYEINREDHSDPKAYELSLESLGDTEKLIDQYYQANQKNIWINYFWIISLSLIIWTLISSFFNTLYINTFIHLGSSFSPEMANFLLYGCSVGLSVLFLYILFQFKNLAFRLYNKIIPVLIKRPAFFVVGILLLPLPILFQIGFSSLLGTPGSSSVSNGWHMLIWKFSFYLSPGILLFKELWNYRILGEKNLESKLNLRLKLCVLAGAFLYVLLKLTTGILGDGSIFLMKYLGLPLSTELMSGISIGLVSLCWIGGIVYLYTKPHNSLPAISHSINKSRKNFSIYFLSLILLIFPAFILTGLMQSTMLKAAELGMFKYHQALGLQVILTNMAFILCLIWSYRRVKNQKLIAWV